MLSMLLAYDAAGNVIATLDYLVAHGEAGQVVGFIDFEAHELASGALLDVWNVSGAVGSGTWPEWLGVFAHNFRAVRGSDGRISKLIHQRSGLIRDRASIAAAVAAVVPDVNGERDLRPILGGPTKPLQLDDQGRTVVPVAATPPQLPMIGLTGNGAG